MKFEAISNRFVRLVAPYFIGLFSLLSVSANNFTASNIIYSITNDPVIVLNGDNPQYIDVGETYEELNATADDVEDGDLTSQISIGGVSGINTNVTGNYIVKYSVTDTDGNRTTVDREVIVRDRQSPVVELTGSSPISIEVGSTYYELGATATDNYDPGFLVTNSIVTSGTVTEEVVASYTITYSALDSSGNVGTVQRIVNVVDTTSPIIDITGDNPATITLGATYDDEGAIATDNYDTGLTVVVGGDTVNTSIVGTYTITYNVSDTAGNPAAQKVRTVNVVDNTDPIITLIGSSEITHEVGTTYDDPGATATDNYDGDLNLQISTNNNVNPNLLGTTYTVEYTVEDSSGNTAQEQRTVHVVDTVDPVISLVGNTTVTIEYQTTYNDPGATATDNYDGNLNNSLTSSSTVNSDELGTYLFSYSVSDSSSNTAQVDRTVSVVDTSPPVIDLIGSDEVNIQLDENYFDAGATAVDAHDGDVTADIITVSSVDTSEVGVYYVTYTVSDDKGNNTLATRTVVVGSPPIITLQGTTPTSVEVGNSYIELGATAFDDPDGDLSENIVTSGSVSDTSTPGGQFFIQYSVSDNDGNSTVVYRTVNVVDTTAPEITLTGDATMNLEVGSTYTELGATATDNSNTNLTVVIGGETVDTSVVSEYTVTYNVSDAVGNPAAEKERTVNVVDTTAPEISINGDASITIEVGSTYTEAGATVTDNYDTNLTVVIGGETVDTSKVDDYLVVYNVSDLRGNSANQVIRTVKVVDTVDPIISLIGNTEVTIEYQSIYTDAGATATDNYDGIISSSLTSSSTVDTDELGEYEFTYTVSDSTGNTAQLTRIVNVVDTISPEITIIGDNPLYINLGETFTDPGYSANDNYDGNITSAVTISGPNVDTSTEGEYFLLYNVTDSSLNAASQQTRKVVVGSPPVITLNGNNPMQLEYQEAYVEPNATATDSGVDLSSSISINGSVIENILGEYFINYSVTDSDGNSVTETRRVIVDDTTKPVITLNGDASQTIEFGNSYNEEGATALDNYDGDISSLILVTGNVDDSVLGNYQLTYNVTDEKDNTAITVYRYVNIVDNQPPSLSLLGNNFIVLEVGSSYTDSGASAIDNYDGNITSSITSNSDLDTSETGNYLITYDVSDSSENTAIQITRSIEVVDSFKPVITLSGSSSVNIEAGEVYTDDGATVTDNYDSGLGYNVDLSIVDTSTLSVYTLTYTATDSSGNQAEPVFRTVEVSDTTSPVISLIGSSNIVIEASQSPFEDPGFTASDSYQGDITPFVETTGVVDMLTLDTYTLRYNVSDNSENPAIEKTRLVTVVDNTPPIIALQGEETINVELNSPFNDPGVTAFDNLDGDLTSLIVKEGNVDTFTAGVYNLTYKLVDSQGNVAQQVIRTVIVGSPPVISLDGDNPMTLEVGTPYVEPGATALDDDEGDLTNQIQISGAVDENQLGQSNIVYTVEDSNGNITNATRIVNVVDTTPPVLVLDDPSIITIEVFSPEYVDQTGFTYTDNFDQNISDSDVIVTDNINENVVDDNYSISFNLSDASGNAAVTQIRQVQVVDTQPPTITLNGDSNVSIEKGSSYVDKGATAQDEYDGNITSSIVVTSNVNESVIGDYSVTYEVSDSSNNPATPVSRSVVVGPDVDAGGPYSVACIGETINIGSASNDLNYDYQWTSQPQPGATGGPVFGDPNSPQTAVTVYTTTLFTLKAYDNNGVEVGSDQVKVDVSGLPEAIVTNPQTICQGESIDLGDSPVSGNSYFWTADSSGWTSPQANPSHSPQSTTTYTLTITNIATGCQDTDQVTITVEEPTVVSLGSDNDTICASEAAIGYTFSAATSTSNNVTHQWSVISGNGSFDNQNELNATYFPGSNDLQTGSASLRLTTTSQGVCTDPVISNFDLNITKEPSIEAGVSAVELCENKSYELNASGTNFDPSSIAWTSSTGDNSTITGGNTLTPTYTPSAGEVASGVPITLTISVTGLDPCDDNGAITDSVTIDLIELPDVSVGTSNASICEDETYKVVGASADNVSSFNWITSGNGSFDNSNLKNPTYTPSDNDIDAGTVTLSLNYVPISPCALPNDFTPPQMTLTINKNPVVDAGPENQILCEGPNQISGATAENYSSLEWITSGTGTFTSENTLSPFYTPGPQDLNDGVVTLTLKAVGEGACTATVESSLNFSVNKLPIISAGANDEVCSLDNYEINDASIIDSDGNNLTPTSILWSSSGSGTFNNPAILNPIYIPSDGDIANNEVVLTMEVTQDGCQLNPDSKILSFVSTAIANAGPDLTDVCEGDDGILTDAIVPDGHSFSWQVIQGSGTLQNETDINPVFKPTDGFKGEAILRLTVNPIQVNGDDCGLPDTDEVSIFIEPSPVVDLGTGDSICQPQDPSTTLQYQVYDNVTASHYNSLQWTAPIGSGSFDNPNILKPIFFPSAFDIANGGVILTLTALPKSPCDEPLSRSMFLEITQKPVINAPSSIDQCVSPNVSATTIELNQITYQFYDRVLWESSSNGSFNDTEDENPTYTPTPFDIESGSVTLTVHAYKDACTLETSKNIIIIFEDLPRVNAGGPDGTYFTAGSPSTPSPEEVDVCPGTNYPLSNADAPGANNITWKTSGTGTFDNENILKTTYRPSPSDRNSGEVTLTLIASSTSACSYEIQDELTLKFLDQPSIEVGPNRSICEGENLDIDIVSGNVVKIDPNSLEWVTNGSGIFNNENSLTTTYIPSDNDLDEPDGVKITLKGTSNDSCDIDVEDSFTLTFSKKPTANAGEDLDICETGVIININENDVTNYERFYWEPINGGEIINPNSLTPEFKPSALQISNGEAMVRLTAVANSPCTEDAKDSITLRITKTPKITLPELKTICADNNLSFTPGDVSIEDENEFNDILWTSSGGGSFTLSSSNPLYPTFTPTADEIADGETKIFLTVQNNAPCDGEVTKEMTLKIDPLPTAEAGNNINFCPDDPPISLSTAFATNVSRVQWTGGTASAFSDSEAEQPIYTPSEEDIELGQITLTLTAYGGGECGESVTATDNVLINFSKTPNVRIEKGDFDNDGTIEYPTEFCGSTFYTIPESQVFFENVHEFQWETSGNGIFSNENSLVTPATTYTPGSVDKDINSVTLTLYGTDINGCKTVSNSIVLDVLDGPSLDLSTSATKACYGTDLSLTAIAENYQSISWVINSGSGQIISGGNSKTPIYRPANDSDIVIFNVTVVGEEPCTDSITDTLEINVAKPLEVTSFPTDTEVCFDENGIDISGVETSGTGGYLKWSTTDGTGSFSNISIKNPTYFPSQEDIVDGFVTLELNTYPDESCWSNDADGNPIVDANGDPDPSDTESFVVTLIPAPVATMSQTGEVCADSFYQVLDATVNFDTASDYEWKIQGDGTLTGVDTLSPTYDPGSLDLSNGEFTLILTVSGLLKNDGTPYCNDTVLRKTVTIVQKPVVELSLDTADYCTSDNPDVDDTDNHDNPILVQFQNLENIKTFNWSTNSIGGGKITPTSDGSAIFYPSQDDYNKGQVTVTLTGNPLVPCVDSVKDELIITFKQAPFVDADITSEENILSPVCEDDPVASTQLNALALDYQSIQWTSSGTGSFDFDNILNPVYEFSAQDFDNGSVTLTITVEGDVNCSPKSDTVQIDLVKKPTVDLGNALIFCGEDLDEISISDVVISGDYQSLSWYTSGPGNLADETTLNPKYLPNPGEHGEVNLYLTVYPKAPCSEPISIPNPKTIIISEPPSVDIGLDTIELCEEDEEITLPDSSLGGAFAENHSKLLWTATGGSGLLTNEDTLTPTYKPSISDWNSHNDVILKLTVTGQDGCDSNDDEETITLKLIPKPVANAGPDVVICATDTNTSLPNQITTEFATLDSSESFYWSVSSNATGVLVQDANDPAAATYTVGDGETGTITLTLTAVYEDDSNIPGGCVLTDQDTMNITINPAPIADIGLAELVCDDQSIELQGSALHYSSVEWKAYVNDDGNKSLATGSFVSKNDLTTTFIPASLDLNYDSIIIELTAIGLDGCLDHTVEEEIIIPYVNAGDDDQICGLEPYTLLNAETNGTNYRWQIIDGNGTFSGQQTSTLLNPVYTPSQLDLERGSVTLQLTVDPSGDCAGSDPISDEIEISITTPPSISVIDHTICQGIEIQNADGSFEIDPTEFAVTGAIPLNYDTIVWEIFSGSGSIAEGTENNVVPTFIPEKTQSEEDTTVLKVTITGSNACGDQPPVTEYVNLYVKPAAELFAGENDSVCENQSEYTLSGATSDNAQNFYWTENGTGEIISGQNTLTPTYEFGTGEVGTVTFTLTADGTGACDNTLTRTFELTIIEQPTATIDPVPVVCSDQVVSLSSTALNYKSIEEDIGTGEPGYEGLFWTSSGSGTFSDSNILNPTYNPSENDILDGVTLYLRAEAIAPCGNDFTTSVDVTFSDAIVVKVMSGDPTPDGHYEDSMCGTDEGFYSLDEAYTENADTWSWSTTNGTGSFSNAEIQNPTYTPSDQDRNNPDPIELVLTAEGGENCLPKTSTLKLTINKLPEIITPSPSIYHCLNDDVPSGIPFEKEGSFNISKYGIITTNSVKLDTVEWITDGDGSFVIGSDVLDPVYQPSPTDIQNGVTLKIRGYGENSCGSEYSEQEIEVTFSPKPEIKYIIDGQGVSEIEVCESSTASVYLDGTVLIDLDNIVWSTTNGTGTFNSKTATKPIYTPSEDDFDLLDGVVLKANAIESNYPGTCAVDELEIVLNLVKKPIINANKTVFEFCKDDDEVTLTGITLPNVPNVGGEEFYDIKWVVSPGAMGYLTSDTNKRDATYKPVGSDFDNGVTLTLIAYGKGNCGFEEEETFQINFTPVLDIDPGISGSICEGEDFPIEGASISGIGENGTFVWEANYSSDINNPNMDDLPNGTFINQGSLTEVIYRPGTNDLGRTVYIFLKPINLDNSICYDQELNNTKFVSIDIAKDVSVYAGPDLTVCGDYSDPVEIFAASNIGNDPGEDEPLVTWTVFSINGNIVDNQLGISDTSSLQTTYRPISIDYLNGISTVLLKVQAAGNICSDDSSSDMMTITYYEPIDATAGDPISVCGNDNPIKIEDAEIISGENSYESIEWDTTPGFGNGFILNKNSIEPTYVFSPDDSGEIRLELRISTKKFDAVEQPRGDGTILEANYNCVDPPVYFKTIFISSDITGTGSIEGESVVCADNNGIAYAYSVGGDLDGVDQYQWSIPEGATYVNGTNENSAIINLLFDSFTENSTKTISVIASNGCGETRDLSKSINIKAQTQLTLDSGQDSDEQELCFGDSLDPIIYQIEGGAKNLQSELEITFFDGTNEILASELISDFSFVQLSNDVTTSGKYTDATKAGTYSYQIKYADTESCFTNEILALGTLTLRAPPVITLDSDPSSDNQGPICSGDEIDDIEYINTGARVMISWSTGAKPIGIDYILNDNPFVISGNPEVQPGEASSTFTYTIIPIDSSGCEGLPQSGSIIVDAASPVEPSNLNLNNEIYCEGENVSFTFFLSDNLTAPLPITYTTQDYDISGNLVGTANSSLINPPGFVPYWDFDQSKLIISGVPSSGPEVRRRYSFEINISSQANACTTALTTNPSGTFFISQSPTLSLYGNQLDINGSQEFTGNKNQELCESVALKPIFIKVDGTNNAPVATGLPIGISQPSPHLDDPTVYVLEGTPSSSNNDNEYNYEIVLESEYGCTETLSGTIYLDKNYQIVLQSTPSTENQEICGNSSLQPISYSYTPGIANAVVNWSVYEIGNNTDTYNQKPSGISVSDSGSVITIEGSPTAIDVNADGTINQNIVSFTIVTTTPNGCTDSGGVDLVQETRDGEFKVTSLPTLERTSQFATTSECEGEDIEIEFEASSNVQPILTWSQNLVGNKLKVVPDINNIWKIKGTVEGITENLSLDYTLIMRDITSLCESVPVLGTVFVENKHELKLISGLKQQDVCEGSDINPIVYEFAGGATSVTTSTLPPGLTPAVDPGNNTITISGTPTSPISIDTPKIFTIETLGSGGLCTKITDTLKINLTPQPRFANLPQNYTLCEGDSVNFIELGLLDGADDVIVSWENNIEPPGTINHEIDDNTSPPTFRFTGKLSGVSEDKTYGFTLIALNSSTGCESTPRQGEITLQNGHELSLELGLKNQEICEGVPIEPIVYKWGGGATSVNVIGLPTGLTRIADNENKRITISGTPTVSISQDEELKFTIKTANSLDSCTEKVDTLTIGLIKQPSIRVLTGSQFQTRICEGVEIDSVVFELFNGATKPFINWEDNIKPPGTINLYDNNDGTHTLKGEITGFDQDKIYNYSITAINLTKGCESTELEGSLGVQKGHELRRLSSYSSTQQKICERQPMASNIIYEFDGGSSSAEVIGLPPGLDWNIDNNLNRLTISGTPIVDVSEVTEYDYKVISLGNDCESIELDGKLTVEPDAEISLESPIATANQFICEGFPIEDITYTFGGGAIDVIYNGLPAGLTPVIFNDPVDPNKVSKLTISGTPNVNVTEDTPFEYSIKALNNNGCVQPELKGTITIKANAELTLLSSSLSQDQPPVCIGSDIIPVNIGYVNSEIPSVSGMPEGLYTTIDPENGILTIQGSITELQLGNPYRKLTIIGTNTNGCRSQEIEIDIEVQPSYSIKPTRVVDDISDTNNPSGASYVKNITCYDNNDGEIMVNLEVGGSSSNYIYSWTGPNNYVETTTNKLIKDLSAGIYVVQVEAQGAPECSISQTYTITEPDPVNIITNEIRPVSCTGSEDGLISVTINGGNENFYRNFIWEVLQEDVSCTTYTVRLRDNDNDGIFDIIDADIDNDGSIDPGKTDVNNDGMIDEANDPNYSFGTVSYQSCDGVFIQNNILRGEFSANGIYQVCAIPNTITADAKLDHDLDPNTDNIASVTISGGSASCSAGTWTKIDRLKGSSLASNLIEGIYRLTVIEGPDLNDIESNDLESLRNDPDICVFEEIYELPKDQILYGSVRVDETYCSLSGGYIDIDVNQSAGGVYFYYDGVRVPNTDVEVIAAEFGINTYRVLIQNPNSNGSFEIRNATGCGVVVAQDLLDTNVLTPIISYTSPELEKYGTISERSNILFTLAGNTSYYRVEWDFGDASPIAVGERVSHQYFADGTYTVTVFVYNASGCFTTTTEEIVVGKGYTILIPNAFSPNGDNINEIIRPVFTGLKAVEYHIYNSQGILVYQEFVSEDNLSPNGTIEIMGWDGENSDPSSNFYVYKIIGTRINEELVTKTGTIFLIE